ncbi:MULTISPECIES: hypothetical protein [Photorhabdus]|nr:hypothetical protein [Photorhabdus luminescens]
MSFRVGGQIFNHPGQVRGSAACQRLNPAGLMLMVKITPVLQWPGLIA